MSEEFKKWRYFWAVLRFRDQTLFEFPIVCSCARDDCGLHLEQREFFTHAGMDVQIEDRGYTTPEIVKELEHKLRQLDENQFRLLSFLSGAFDDHKHAKRIENALLKAMMPLPHARQAAPARERNGYPDAPWHRRFGERRPDRPAQGAVVNRRERLVHLLQRSAELLEREARCLKESHSRSDGEWHLVDPIDHGAKREHDEVMETARELRRFAQDIVKTK